MSQKTEEYQEILHRFKFRNQSRSEKFTLIQLNSVLVYMGIYTTGLHFSMFPDRFSLYKYLKFTTNEINLAKEEDSHFLSSSASMARWEQDYTICQVTPVYRLSVLLLLSNLYKKDNSTFQLCKFKKHSNYHCIGHYADMIKLPTSKFLRFRMSSELKKILEIPFSISSLVDTSQIIYYVELKNQLIWNKRGSIITNFTFYFTYCSIVKEWTRISLKEEFSLACHRPKNRNIKYDLDFWYRKGNPLVKLLRIPESNKLHRTFSLSDLIKSVPTDHLSNIRNMHSCDDFQCINYDVPCVKSCDSLL